MRRETAPEQLQGRACHLIRNGTLFVECLMLFADLGKTVRSCPGTVRRCENRFVREWTRSAFSESSKRLIEPAVIEKTEYKHGAGKFGTAVF